jgi:hypothetical protein
MNFYGAIGVGTCPVKRALFGLDRILRAQIVGSFGGPLSLKGIAGP